MHATNHVTVRSSFSRRPSDARKGRRRPLLFAVMALLMALPPLAVSPAAAEPAPAASSAALLQVTPVDDLVADLQRAAPSIDPAVLRRAVTAAVCAADRGLEVKQPRLTVIDYSLPSTQPRLWVFDLVGRSLLHRELVAHGVGSGGHIARTFSNTPESRQSSLGLFLTAETYYGKNGYSLRLDGLEKGINHLARPRTIVIHGAWYVSEAHARQHGRLGRSWGCPALDDAVARQVIDQIAGGSLLYVDHREDRSLRASDYLACAAA